MSKRVTLFISTEKGLFQGKLNGSVGDVHPLGLERCGRIWPVVVDHRRNGRLYAATHRGGIWRSDDFGGTWHEINSGLLYKEVWCIAQHPVTGELYAGTGPTSVFKSVDYGDTWENCSHLHTLKDSKDWTFPQPPHVAHVKGLGLHPDNPNLVLGAIEEGWLVRSVDGGRTWVTLKEGTEFDSHTVNVMPDNPRILVSLSGTGCYRSEDGGDRFVKSNEGLTRTYMAQLVVHPKMPEVLFTAAAEVPPYFWRRPEGANTQFFRSDDQGKSWKPLHGGLPEHFKAAARSTAGDPEQPGSFLVGMSDGDIWMTRDGGEHFTKIASGFPAIYGLTIARG